MDDRLTKKMTEAWKLN